MTNQILKSTCWYLKLSEQHFLIRVSRLPNKQGNKKKNHSPAAQKRQRAGVNALIKGGNGKEPTYIINKPSVVGWCNSTK